MTGWHIEGQYMETCNCTFLCPCITTNLSGTPTEGDCKAALALRIDKGEKDGVDLAGAKFIVLLHSPGPMGEGNVKVGLIIDDGASDAQAGAIGDIVGGSAGGPMAAIAPLVGEVAGIERRPISFEQDGMAYRVSAGELIDQALDGVATMAAADEPVYVDNAPHPVSTKLALARASHSRFHAFGIDWEDASGTRNGHFAPFSWNG